MQSFSKKTSKVEIPIEGEVYVRSKEGNRHKLIKILIKKDNKITICFSPVGSKGMSGRSIDCKYLKEWIVENQKIPLSEWLRRYYPEILIYDGSLDNQE